MTYREESTMDELAGLDFEPGHVRFADPVPTVERDVYYTAALAWAQEFGFNGDELPHGRPFHTECPLYLATGLLIDYDCALDAMAEPCVEYPLPKRVTKFAIRFDAGKYPELVL